MITVDFKRLGLRAGDRILDIGCGTGRHIGGAARFAGITAIGADIRIKDLDEARERLEYQERLGECRGQWQFMAANIRRLPFADAAFDRVICSEVLEHVVDHRTAAVELVRVLKPAGCLAVSVPRYLPERVCWALSTDYRTAKNGHVRIYRERELAALFEPMGLRRQGRGYAHSLHTPYWWLKCVIGPDRRDSAPVNFYHRILVWDLMKHPRITRWLDHLLNPVLGKSMVLYFRKGTP